MRILFLAFRDPANPYNGGGDIYINELAMGCARNGHSVTFLSSKFLGAKPEENMENLNVIRLGSKFSMFLLVFAYYFVHLRGRFDVVVEEIIGGPRVPFFASAYMKEKLVGIIQQRHEEIFRQQFSLPIATLLWLLERLLVIFYRDNHLIVNSARTKEELRGIGYQLEKMHVVYPGVRSDFFSSGIPDDFSERKDRVICLAKMRRYKLIDLVVRAFQSVIVARPDCELIIAGRTNDVDPGYEAEIRELVKELKLGDNLRFEKDVSESRKIELLKSSRALILPSAIEGFSIAVIEANAYGTPAITSDRVPAAINGQNAIITPCFDVNSLSKAIILLLSDEARWRELSARASAFAKRFTWNASVTRFNVLIEEIYRAER